MRAMRNRRIHHYFDINTDVLWSTVNNDLPRLKQQVDALLKRQGREPAKETIIRPVADPEDLAAKKVSGELESIWKRMCSPRGVALELEGSNMRHANQVVQRARISDYYHSRHSTQLAVSRQWRRATSRAVVVSRSRSSIVYGG